MSVPWPGELEAREGWPLAGADAFGKAALAGRNDEAHWRPGQRNLKSRLRARATHHGRDLRQARRLTSPLQLPTEGGCP